MTASPALVLTGLGARRLRFGLACETPVQLSAFPGFTLFGALKRRLAARTCAFGPPPCRKACAAPEACVYGRVFETRGPAEKGLRNAPAPLVLHLPESTRTAFAPGEVVRFEARLLGADPQPAAYLLGAVRALERSGLGTGERGRVRLVEAVAVSAEGARDLLPALGREGAALLAAAPAEALVPPPPGGRVALQFETPLRLRHHERWLNEHDLTVRHLAEATLLRLKRLGALYGDGEGAPRDWAPFQEAADAARVVERELIWWKAERRSRNHPEPLPLDGVLGRLVLDGVAPELAALLTLGAALHLGSKTTHGYGQLALGAHSA